MELPIYDTSKVVSQEFNVVDMYALKNLTVGDMEDPVEKAAFQEIWNRQKNTVCVKCGEIVHNPEGVLPMCGLCAEGPGLDEDTIYRNYRDSKE